MLKFGRAALECFKHSSFTAVSGRFWKKIETLKIGNQEIGSMRWRSRSLLTRDHQRRLKSKGLRLTNEADVGLLMLTRRAALECFKHSIA